MRNKFFIPLILALALSFATTHSVYAQFDADDERSDSVAINKAPDNSVTAARQDADRQDSEQQAADHQAPASSPDSATVSTVQRMDQPEPVIRPSARSVGSSGGSSMTEIESFGILKSPQMGGLGIDMWDGSDRAAIASLIPQLPDSYSFRTVRSLVRRALATNADVSMLSGPPTAPDLLTLRIRKLMAMGALDEAAALYKDNTVDIHSPLIADEGLLAILYSNHSALACLETKARIDHFASAPFWQEMNGLCDYLLQKVAGQPTGKTVQATSPIINKIISDAHFRYAFAAHDFEKLTPLEQGMLVADHRIDYSTIKKSDIGGFASSTIALLARDPSAPGALRFELMLAAARQGIVSPTELDAFYQAQNFPSLAGSNEQVGNLKNYSGYQKVEWLAKSTDVAHGQIDKAALPAALSLRNEFGLTALWPFAPLLAEASPAGLSPDAIRTGMMLGLVTDSPISQSWVNQWKKIESTQKSDFLIHVAYDIQTNSSLDGITPSANFTNQFKGLPKGQQETVKILYEKLDKHISLHNITMSKVYENATDLTTDEGYVMPSKDLMNSLTAAGNDKRLGEVILLSAIALHGTSPAHMPPGLLNEVVREFETVGLTKETREFAMEAILGLGQ